VSLNPVHSEVYSIQHYAVCSDSVYLQVDCSDSVYLQVDCNDSVYLQVDCNDSVYLQVDCSDSVYLHVVYSVYFLELNFNSCENSKVQY
jgi:hypothetical protein